MEAKGVTVEEMLEDLDNISTARNHELTDWEMDFIAKVKRRIKLYPLTDAQEEKLAEIWRTRT